ncbi:alpha-ribazole phosphatase family protein [Thiothrix subterranea]|uniref:alpha-ribazole phosphatase family protein n=1 Tax=Thiothrix subterranea TaxID=2735563 RepID=UPI00192C3CFC|nr:alpha-ribazole phosphatase family protein [Thiothrix subterranea]QQZ30159.1 alpha-ribazole phosphatase family protein [Thiothrix subterranea]
MANNFTHIGLLQHGAVEAGDVFCGELDTPLTKASWKQLKQAFGRASPDWDAVVTSPRMQCAAFAEWFAQKQDLPLVRDERLREIHFGEWEGRNPQDVMTTHPEALAQWWLNPAQVSPPSGESFGDFRARVLDAWTEMGRAYRGERVLVVTHALVIRVIIAHVLQMSDERLLALNIEYGALTRLRVLRDRSGEWASLLVHGCG